MSNLLKDIPDSIFSMEALKILNISQNKLTRLSEAIGNAKLLNELNVGGNDLKELP